LCKAVISYYYLFSKY